MKNFAKDFLSFVLKDSKGKHSPILNKSKLFIYLPSISKDDDLPELNQKKLGKMLSKHSICAVALPRECSRYLKKLNHTEVKPDVRFKLTEVVLDVVGQHIANSYREFASHKFSVPEDSLRKEKLTNALLLVDELVMSYKHVLSQYYTIAKMKNSEAVKKSCLSAERVMELMRWRQRLAALRYQKLSNRDWKDINQIFFAILSVDDVRRPYQCVRNLQYFDASNYPIGFSDKTVSFLHLYISIHISGLMDIISWPVHLMHIVDTYFDQYADKVDLVVQQNVSPTDRHVIVHKGQNTYADFEEKEKENESNDLRVLLDLSQLIDQVQGDYKKVEDRKFVGEEVASIFPQMLYKLRPSDYITALELMSKYLRQNIRKNERKPVFGGQEVRVYSGFVESYRFLRACNSTHSSEMLEDRKFRDALARYSTVLVDNGANEESFWHVMNESRGGVMINMPESSYCPQFRVGQLVALSVGEDENIEVRLGCINRLHRCREKDVEVAIIKLTSYLEHVAIGDPDVDDELLPAFLIRNLEDQWQLILQPRKNFISGMPLMLRRKKENFPVRLGSICMSKYDFLIHDVRSPNL